MYVCMVLTDGLHVLVSFGMGRVMLHHYRCCVYHHTRALFHRRISGLSALGESREEMSAEMEKREGR